MMKLLSWLRTRPRLSRGVRRGRKRKTNLYLSSELIREAKELGLNISRIAEEALRIAIIKAREARHPA